MIRLACLLCLLVLPCLGLLASCGDDGAVDDAWTSTREEDLTPAQKQQRKQAFAAKDQMFHDLSSALVSALREEGPGPAIDVCRVQAPKIAARVAKAREVRIGRTSHRLRNPKNRPPAWAVPFVETQQADNAYVIHADGRFGALLPIRLQQPCLGCHGDPAKAAPAVKASLEEHYPKDEATGFAAGDLRGWFWVEVPAVRTGP